MDVFGRTWWTRVVPSQGLVVLTLVAVGAALSLSAMAVHGQVPGNNGTVKIHAAGTNADDPRTEPHPCVFYIAGFGFDPAATGTYAIRSWPPSDPAGVLVAQGAWGPADGSGDWQTELMNLPDGHYKLFVEQLVPRAPGGAKQKTFWIECGPTPVIPEASTAVLVSTAAALLLATGLLARRSAPARTRPGSATR